MTLAAARHYAFGTVVAVGLVAALMAAALVSALLSPEQMLASMGEGDLTSLLRLIVRRLATAVQAVIRLL